MISSSLEQTKKIAHEFASMLVGGDIVFLEGDLGVGKTSFVQGILEAFGYTEPVRSPTFSIMNTYPIANHPTIQQVIHLDFYRFETPNEIRSLGLEEMMQNTKNIFLIEWPEKGIEDALQIRYTKRIQIRSVDERTREINIF